MQLKWEYYWQNLPVFATWSPWLESYSYRWLLCRYHWLLHTCVRWQFFFVWCCCEHSDTWVSVSSWFWNLQWMSPYTSIGILGELLSWSVICLIALSKHGVTSYGYEAYWLCNSIWVTLAEALYGFRGSTSIGLHFSSCGVGFLYLSLVPFCQFSKM